jgi:hypothetical protein
MTDAAPAAPATSPSETSSPAQNPSTPASSGSPVAGVEGKAVPASAVQSSPSPASKEGQTVLSDAKAPEAPEASKESQSETPAENFPEVKYDLKFQEGSVLAADQPLIKDFTELAKKENMSPELAQKVVDFAPKLSERIAQENQKVWNELNTNWQKEVKSDPEIGGKNWTMTEKNLAYVRDTYTASPEENQALKQALLLTGAGNNPVIVKWISRMAAQLAEPSTIPAKSGGSPKGSGASALYPTMKSSA